MTAPFLPSRFRPLRPLRPFLLLSVLASASFASLLASEPGPSPSSSALDGYNVTWTEPGPSSRESMPIGNGDIGLNVWVEPNGDLAFYIGKTDAWSEQNRGSRGLMKLGKVVVSLNPNPFAQGSPFRQSLKLREGEILVEEGGDGNGTPVAQFRVWVDANHPVIRVETKSKQPMRVKVAMENWRTKAEGPFTADTILTDHKNAIAWYHRNGEKSDPEVMGRTFGAVIKGTGMASKDATTLESVAAGTSQVVSIYPLTTASGAAQEWVSKLDTQVAALEVLNLDKSRQEHQAWWSQFWNRSWVFVQGDPLANQVTQGYLLQRFITACGGRGDYPIKFNGSIFVVDFPALKSGTRTQSVNADYRTWGGQYWFQNTRAAYWPCLEAGDFDFMRPLFQMYARQLQGNAALVKQYYGHKGAYFAETAPFWGGLKYVGPEMPENWSDHYFTPILELSMMMLDYFEYTGDRQFAKETLLPIANAGLTFFDKHFYRDGSGKLLLDPDNAIEMYWKVHDPAPDIAGLRSILTRLLALPNDLASASDKAHWGRFLKEIPELPTGTRNNKQILLPYTGAQNAKRRNGENPELYALFPFRLYGLEKPGLDLMLRTFNARTCKQKGCWVQDPMQAAMLGRADTARDYVSFALTRKEPDLKFPAFWAHGCDYAPDQDNGGNGQNGLQQMLVQGDGKKILLLPAWPKGWNAAFKLHAPLQTTVQGRVINGKLMDMVVTPPERKADVIDLSQREPAAALPKANSSTANAIENFIAPQDPIVPIELTAKGRPNIPSDEAVLGGQTARFAIDGSLGSKYFNKTRDNQGNPGGVGTGFVVTPAASAKAATGIQFATGNDMPGRDPLSITIEGSNDPEAGKAGGNGFTLLYEGPTGLENDPGRCQWGPVVAFKNSTAFKSYRVLVIETRDSATDGAQYSEIKFGAAL